MHTKLCSVFMVMQAEIPAQSQIGGGSIINTDHAHGRRRLIRILTSLCKNVERNKATYRSAKSLLMRLFTLRFQAIEAMSTAWHSAFRFPSPVGDLVRLRDAASRAKKPDRMLKRHDGRKSTAMLDLCIEDGTR